MRLGWVLLLGIATVGPGCTSRRDGLVDLGHDGSSSAFGSNAGDALVPAPDSEAARDTNSADLTPVPDAGAPDATVMVDAVAPDAGSLTPDSAPLAPDAAPAAPDAAPAPRDSMPPMPDSAPLLPDSAPSMPDAAPLTDSAPLMPDTAPPTDLAATGGATYEIRVASTTIPADGYSKLPVLVLGRNADGSPSSAKVVLNITRAGAGTFDSPALTLRPLGAETYFVPCSSITPGCLGTFRMTLALAERPDEPVATTGDLQLVAPVGVGNPAPCQIGGNVIFFDGNDYIYRGTETIKLGTWSSSGSDRYLSIHVDPSDSSQGLWWDLDFSTQQLGQSIREQVYTDAERAPFASPGHPGIDIGGDGRGCNQIKGKFQVEEIQWENNKLLSFTATFEQHCEGGTSALRGCVHYEAP
jgi:hypothetical protein